MDAFMVVATFKDGTEMSEVFAVVAQEQARVKVLEAEGKISSIHLSLARGTVFIETHADNAQEAELTIQSLPMAQWWKLEIFPLAPAQNPAAQP